MFWMNQLRPTRAGTSRGDFPHNVYATGKDTVVFDLRDRSHPTWFTYNQRPRSRDC